MDSRTGLLEREQEVMKILNLLLDKELEFIVVGGYAISTYKKRFSIDLDVVVKEEDLENFEKCKLIWTTEKQVDPFSYFR